HAEGDAEARAARFMDRIEEHDGVPLQVVENTGAAGDVILMHPLTLHVAAPNNGDAPRFLMSGGVDTPAMWAGLGRASSTTHSLTDIPARDADRGAWEDAMTFRWAAAIAVFASLLTSTANADDLGAILAKAAAGKKAPGSALLTIQGYKIVDEAAYGVR